MTCSSVSLRGSHRLSLPKSDFSLCPGTSQHSQKLRAGWSGCVGRLGPFPIRYLKSSSPMIPLAVASIRVLPFMLVDNLHVL